MSDGVFRFLSEDFEILKKKIREMETRLNAVRAEVRGCNERGESVFESFTHENAVLHQEMWAGQIKKLKELRDNALIVHPDPASKAVGVGNVVVYRDEDTGERKRLKIGSFQKMNDERDCASYNSPLGRLFYGAEAGEVRDGEICGRRRSLKVLKIS